VKVGTTNEAARRAWVREALANVPPGARLLDAGAGEGQYRPFCTHLRYVSQDFAQYEPEGSAEGLQVDGWSYMPLDIVSDITAIPEPDGSFDAVLCAEVLEHVPDPPAALRELTRLLRSGGTLILTAPFASATHFAPYHFSTGFSRYWYEHHLTRLGFTIDELSPNGDFFEYVAQELWRVPLMTERYAGGRLPLWAKPPLYLALRTLELLAPRGRRSHEFLCHGWHVRATRT
jgi:ubiquinone/menaquinone biosynthesis C-methylase UbiE